jgi:hypothetical protein
LNKKGAFMNAQLALNHIIKTLFFAGCRINFNDDIVVVAHDCKLQISIANTLAINTVFYSLSEVLVALPRQFVSAA